MQVHDYKLELLALTEMLIDSNKIFTDALKAKRPHSELVQIFSQIQTVYNQINTLKEQDKVAA